jgi:uncharacterized membrane protein YtjA (UPF0391 family)
MRRSLRSGTPDAMMAWQLTLLFTLTNWETMMLYWAAVFLIIAIIAGVFGFGGIAAGSASIAQILFFVFLVLFVLSLLMGRRTPMA